MLLRRMMRNSLQKQKKDKGVKGILPLVCLPLWGREGVTLIDFPKELRMTGFTMKDPW